MDIDMSRQIGFKSNWYCWVTLYLQNLDDNREHFSFNLDSNKIGSEKEGPKAKG